MKYAEVPLTLDPDDAQDLTEVVVDKLPECDLCKVAPVTDPPNVAAYDGKTRMGPWAYMCEECFKVYGIGLGLGVGQRLVLRESEEEGPRQLTLPGMEVK